MKNSSALDDCPQAAIGVVLEIALSDKPLQEKLTSALVIARHRNLFSHSLELERFEVLLAKAAETADLKKIPA